MKKIIIVILAILSVLLAGCGGDTTGGDKTSPFLGGTTGLTLNFAEGAPPAEAFDAGDSPFDIIMILENKGEYTVPASDVVVSVKGILASDFGKTEAEITNVHPAEDLEATKKNSEGDILPGAPVYVEFTDFNHADQLTGNTPFTVLAQVCYKYENQAQAMLCVKEDNIDITTEGRVCAVQETKSIYNSGGPVQIGNFKEFPAAANKVKYNFDVIDSGTGDIYLKDTTCAKDPKSNEDKIWVDIQTTIGGTLTCSGLTDGTATSGYVKLYEGKKQVTCTQEVETSSDYESPVNIVLQYDYEQSKTKNILVKHLEN